MSGFYSTANWQRIRTAQLAREPVCQGCEQTPAVEVDHIQRINAGGSKRDRANLQSLCRACHAGKTACEREGRTWTPPVHRGSYEDGTPRDPAHPWHTGGRSITASPASGPVVATQKSISSKV